MLNPFNRGATVGTDSDYIQPVEEFVDLVDHALQVSPGPDQSVSARDLNISKQIKMGANLSLMTSYFGSDKTIDISSLPSPDELKEEKFD